MKHQADGGVIEKLKVDDCHFGGNIMVYVFIGVSGIPKWRFFEGSFSPTEAGHGFQS